MHTIPKPAWETHPDGEDSAVRQRLEGSMELGPGILGLDELKESCKRAADEGVEPDAIVELGLLLPEDDYETLKGYARGLKIKHSLVRRRRSRV